MSKKILSILLALVMLLSLAAPIIPVSAATEVSATESETPTSDLRVGILSDIHVSYDYEDEVYGSVSGYFNGVQPTRFEKALRFFKAKGVEAVVVAGDLQEASGTTEASLDAQKDWLQTVVDIWFEVFPEAPGEEGYVEPIFTYGNHDTALIAEQYWPEEWGTYEDAFVKTVNGYSFVCTHNGMESLAAPLLAKVNASNGDQPIFYIQHCPIYNTVPGSTSGYGVGYGQTGRANLADYPNAVGFNGHTHVPLTDEKSIWQGDSGNEGQFTVINTATINYTGLNVDGMSVNSYVGNAQQTEHGMIMDVTGSEVSIDRYSFNDMTVDSDGNVSGNAVKLGETWAWDACDVTDRPYAWDTRYETANAPVFADGAAVTVDTITDTSVTVTVPAASLTAPEGYSDMISSYVVEACNPTTGEAEATGRIATSYHVDDKADVYESTYTVTVSGLSAGTNYTLKVYAQEFFAKRSQPLTVSITTTGTLSEYRRGDVNKDGSVDAADMTALEEILAAPSSYNYDGDIDLNGINETRDITELQAILDGEKITYPETGDLMDRVTKVTLTGVSTSTNYQPVDYGTTIQNQVVRGDSNQSVKTWTTNYAYYPVTTMYFDEPIDLSGYTHLSFDTLFENEYNLSDSYRKRWLSLSFISGEQEQVASYGSMNFDANSEGWTTKTISLASLKNIDLTAVTGIRFSHNFDYYEGRYDGVTEHAIYWDNFYGLVIEGSDADLLSGATITGGSVVYGAGYTNNTNQAIQSTGGTLDFVFESAKVLTDYAGIKVDMRTPVTTEVQVQALDADGNAVGTAVTVSSCNIYQNVNISVPAMGLEEGTEVSGIRFTYTCESLLLDNMQLQGSKDYDLIGTATKFANVGGDSCTAFITTEGGNGSNNAIYASAAPGTSVWGGGGELTYETPLDLSQTPYLRFDMKVQNAHWALGLVLYNSDGEVIWQATHYNATSSGGQYATYEFDLRTYRTYDDGYTYHEVTAEQLKDVAKIRLTCDLASSPSWMTSDDTALREVWFDNLVACNPLEDFFGADTSLIGPSAVQDGFVCEIMPTTADGHTEVLHWYADPSNNAGTTSNWPGSTVVTITKDVNLMNHSGYEGSYDYLEFDLKTTGMYIAMYLTVKDASGATLGSTGEYRISYEQEWSTFRVDATALGMSQEDFNNIAQVEIGWNWQHQNATGTADQYVADVYIDNMGLRSIDTESEDLLDQVSLIRNADWWTGCNGKFTGGGWKFQSEVTAESDKALMFYRSETSQNISYGDKTLYMYFNEPITLDSGWSLELDAIKHNYNASGGTVQLIGSDGNKYTVFTLSHTGSDVYTYSTLVSAISDFDPTTTTVTGLYFKYPMNPDSTMDKTADGYMVLDNLNIAIPEPMDEDDFLYAATCGSGQNQTAVTNNSLSAWELTPASGWSYPQFTLANAADISNHTLTMDIMITGTSSFRMHLATINGDWSASSGGAVYYDADQWHTVSYDLSTNGASITEMTAFSLGIECTLADGSESCVLYIDNVTLTDNDAEPEETEPEVTEPEETEPEVTEPEVTEDPASPNPEDPGDLLGATNTISYNQAHWDNLTENATGLIGEPVTDTVYGSQSTRSWAFKATADANQEAVAQLAMHYAYDMTGKALVFDVMFECEDTAKTLILNTRLHEAETWADVTTNMSKTLKPGYWQTVVLDFSSNMVSGKDLTAVQFITFTMNFSANTGVERALYIDNVRLVETETIEDDLIHCKVDSGSTPTLYWLSDEYTYGDSTLSMRVENQDSSDKRIYYSPQSQYGNDNLPDYKNKIIAGYFYFGDQTPYATLQLVDKSWSGVIGTGFTFEDVGDGWYYGQVNTARITTHSATTDLTQCIRLAIFIASGATVYIDGLTVLPGESGADDWTNILIDSGATKGTYGPNTEYTYGDSVVSMRYEPTDGACISFHTENEVARYGGAWDAYPDFTSGLFSAYIYFGDQDPYVAVKLVDSAWKSSTVTEMTLEDVGDGWYHATIDATTITVPDGFDITAIIRIYMYFTAGQKVYIDEMNILPWPNCMEDHLANSPGVHRPTSGIEDGYVVEILDSYDGFENVFHINADPNNGGGTTTNWIDAPGYYVAETNSYYSAEDYDFYEFTFKGTGHYSDISVTFYDESNTSLGSVSGLRLSHKDSGWMTFRINLADAGLTTDEVALIRRVSFGFNWKYQNSTGTDLLEADLYWRDCGFGCTDEESDNLLDKIDSIRNKDYWYGGFNNYPGAGWYFDEDGAFTFYRSTNSTGMDYTPRNMYVYFQNAVTVNAGDSLSLDIVNTNFTLSSKLEIIGSDGNYYVFGNVNQTGSYNLTVCVDDLATSDGTAFDPATVTITGIKFYNNFNADSNIDATAGGTLAYTSLTVIEATTEE